MQITPDPNRGQEQSRIEDHRAVPLDILREFVRSEAEILSVAHVAEDAGVGRSTVYKFMSDGTSCPQPRVRRLLARWYLRRRDGIDELELIRPYMRALDVLLVDVPETERPGVTMDVLVSIRKAVAAHGEEAPRWLDPLRKRRVGWLLGDS